MASLNEILGTLPSGSVAPLDDSGLARYIHERYISNDAEKKRRRRMRMRIDLFRDKGEEQINQMVRNLFANDRVRSWRMKFVELAQFQNVTKRIVREISTVYSEPAVRTVAKTNKQYQDLQLAVGMDRRMRLTNQMTNLCNNVYVWPDVADGVPMLRVVTPDNFWAVSHPNDPIRLVAIVIDIVRHGARSQDPHFLVIGAEEFIRLDGNGMFIDRRPHSIGRIPGILTSRSEDATSLLDPDAGEDLLSAHKALALINLMLLKNQKSGNRQAYAAGDLSDTPTGQPMDPEHILQVGDGVTLSTLDLGADPDSYIKVGRAVLKQIAANYGIPESVFDLSYQATSGFEIELKRTGLREVRRDQILTYRPMERNLAEIMSSVAVEARHPFAFNPVGWSIDFGEMETPQDPEAMLRVWEKQRQMGLMNTVEMYMLLNPEATEDEAMAAIIHNAEVEAIRVELFRKLNISPSTPADGSDNEDREPPDDDEEEEQEEATA